METYEENYLYHAMNIGEQMLLCGAEVSRVEDTVTRICTAYGAHRVDVFTITSSIVVTINDPNFGVQTQTRRIRSQDTDLHLLERFNDLSRKICAEQLPLSEVKRLFEEIMRRPVYSFLQQVFSYALVSGSFTIFFGGTWSDMLVSTVIGGILKGIQYLGRRINQNPFLLGFLYAVSGGFLANLAVAAGLGHNVDKISIGNIMLFIPGIMFTNAIRDMFSGDMITGMTKFAEAVLLAVVIALGFILSNFIL